MGATSRRRLAHLLSVPVRHVDLVCGQTLVYCVMNHVAINTVDDGLWEDTTCLPFFYNCPCARPSVRC
jgi:hypothetical protein